jgi:hypothetical protein
VRLIRDAAEQSFVGSVAERRIRVADHISAGPQGLTICCLRGSSSRLVGLGFMKIVSISESDKLRSATMNAVDALDREIDAVWGLIAIIEVMGRESRDDNYARGALRVAHNHLDALIAIRDGLGGA